MLIESTGGCTGAKYGISAYDGSVVNCAEADFTYSIRGTPGNYDGAGISAWTNSSIYAYGADASYSYYGVISTEGASLDFKQGTATNCERHASRAVSAAFLDVSEANLSNSATHGVYGRHACVINANYADFSNAGVSGVYSLRACNISAIESTADNCPIGYYADDVSSITCANSSAKNCDHAIQAERSSFINGSFVDAAGSSNVATIDSNSRANLQGIECDSPTTGIIVRYNSHVNCANAIVTNSANTALSANWGCTVHADASTFTNAGTNAVSTISSFVSAREVDCTGSNRGFVATGASTIDANNGIANNCADAGVYCLDGSTINFNSGSATGCEIGIQVSAGRVDATSANVSGATQNGVNAQAGSEVSLRLANCRRGGSDDPTDIVCLSASIVKTSSTTGGVNLTLNTPSSSGLILG